MNLASFLPRFCTLPSTEVMDRCGPEMIATKAVICLPEAMSDIVLRRYVEYVHPQLPVLDMSHVVEAIDGGKGQVGISFLLWQALSTAVIPLLTDAELGMAGLVSGAPAMITYFHRSKVRMNQYIVDTKLIDM